MDCEVLAQFFWTGWEGAVLRAKLERRPDALDLFAEGFFAMIQSRDERGIRWSDPERSRAIEPISNAS
jgi:hypothetical protein